jgi:hypothetical protein
MHFCTYVDYELSIVFKTDNNYVNATDLSRRYFEKTNKRREPGDWLRLKRTKETLNYVSSVTGIPVTGLVQVFQGGLAGTEIMQQGTFIHPDLAIPFASWLSVEFEYKVTKVIQKYLLEEMTLDTNEQIKTLQDLLGSIMAYVEGYENFGATFHTGIHRQLRSMKELKERINSYLGKKVE